jgi:hypothetical protein
MKPRFILNRNEGQDVIHDRSNFDERCNTDDAEDKQNVDAKTAAALIASGAARVCEHCVSDPT